MFARRASLPRHLKTANLQSKAPEILSGRAWRGNCRRSHCRGPGVLRGWVNPPLPANLFLHYAAKLGLPGGVAPAAAREMTRTHGRETAGHRRIELSVTAVTSARDGSM